ncbi:hypothetical protein [Actinopolymorpha pittospori]
MGRQPKPTRPAYITRWQWYWWVFISKTGLRELLFWLDASVPGFRGRLYRLYHPWDDRSGPPPRKTWPPET